MAKIIFRLYQMFILGDSCNQKIFSVEQKNLLQRQVKITQGVYIPTKRLKVQGIIITARIQSNLYC
ncbi:unnamed protein product [Paramecium octaurelia]|uniref:Uncharacterized protein n=1 Tax=Paramecium octaurelia TaxID=43137 RepID=A0A8S1SJ63_PAROT|nr:unnamed protein product [Paramecium octaurelia]